MSNAFEVAHDLIEKYGLQTGSWAGGAGVGFCLESALMAAQGNMTNVISKDRIDLDNLDPRELFAPSSSREITPEMLFMDRHFRARQNVSAHCWNDIVANKDVVLRKLKELSQAWELRHKEQEVAEDTTPPQYVDEIVTPNTITFTGATFGNSYSMYVEDNKILVK